MEEKISNGVITDLAENYEYFVNTEEEVDTVKVLGYKGKYINDRYNLLSDVILELLKGGYIEDSTPWLIVTTSIESRVKWIDHFSMIEKKDSKLINKFLCIDIDGIINLHNYMYDDYNIIWDLDDNITLEAIVDLTSYKDFLETIILYNEDTIDSLKRLRYHLSDNNFVYLNAESRDDGIYYSEDKKFDVALVESNFGMETANSLSFPYYTFNTGMGTTISYDSIERNRLLYKSKSYFENLSVMTNTREYYTLFSDKINILKTALSRQIDPDKSLVKAVEDKILNYKNKQKAFTLDNKTNKCLNLTYSGYNSYKTIMINPLPRLKTNIKHINHTCGALAKWMTTMSSIGVIINKVSDIDQHKFSKAEMVVFTVVNPSIFKDILLIRELNPDTKIVVIFNPEVQLENKVAKRLKTKFNSKNYDIKNFINLLSE